MKRISNLYKPAGSDVWHLDYIHPMTKKRVRHTTKTTDYSKAHEMFKREQGSAFDQKNLGKLTDKTVAQLVEWCWENYWCFKPQANKKTKMLALIAILRKFGDIKAVDLTPDMLREFMRERLVLCKISTVKRDFVNIATAYNQAIRNKLLIESPFRMLETSTLNEDHLRRNRVATEEEIDLLLGNSAGVLHSIIDFVLNTGFRKGEVENLKWSDVDFKHKRIATQTHKGGRKMTRNIPMLAGARRVLESLPRGTEFVFTNHVGDRIPRDGMIHAGFPRLVDRCGIKDLTFHDLRHTFATWYYRKDFNLRAVQIILGHRKSSTTERYLNLTEADLVPAGNFDSSLVCQVYDKVVDNEDAKTLKSVDSEASAVSSVG